MSLRSVLARPLSRPIAESCPVCREDLRIGWDGRVYCEACDYVECGCQPD